MWGFDTTRERYRGVGVWKPEGFLYNPIPLRILLIWIAVGAQYLLLEMKSKVCSTGSTTTTPFEYSLFQRFPSL